MLFEGKLYVIIYLVGHMIGYIGPLPYDSMDECKARVDIINAQRDDSIVTPEGHTAKDVRMECERHLITPKVPEPSITLPRPKRQ